MGPLVPHIISDEFSYVIAVLLGFGFGFALEQAGFSSTRKLVGLFYGYDFTVLRVFFTAGVTAMLGVLVLDHLGLLDLSLIYVNPTFLRSAILGGLIMGAGFIIGGFCPGTSVCAAVVGKIDAMVFLLGALAGIYAFAESYPALEAFYLADNWGQVRINEYLGMPALYFAALLSAAAVIIFYLTDIIQNWVTKRPILPGGNLKKHGLLALSAFFVIGLIGLTPSYKSIIQKRIANAQRQKNCVFKEITSDKLAYEMLNNYYRMNLIDVRPPHVFKAYHLPLAVNVPFDSMANREWEGLFNQRHKKNIFYADDEITVKKACLLAKHLGNSDNYILRENSGEFQSLFFKAVAPDSTASKDAWNAHRFRVDAAASLMALDSALGKLNRPVLKKFRKVKGGCS